MSNSSYSPFRYPGGKAKLINYLKIFIKQNNLMNGLYIEPFSGGGSVALALAIDGVMDEVVINDLDRSIYAAWHCVLNEPERMIYEINKTLITVGVWEEQVAIQKNKENEDLFKLGFSTFFLNRTNFSGIIKGGCIGGIDQLGNYKINARFNKIDLINRISLISKHRNKIKLYNLDVVSLLDRFKNIRENNFVYFDPPYYIKGEGLYVNFFKEENHRLLAEKIKGANRFNWLVSYDNHEFIQNLYKDFTQSIYELSYSAGETKSGSEIIFVKPGLILPSITNPSKITNREAEKYITSISI